MQASFWRHKKVLITGHTGFKGSWLALWLQSLGAEVIGYALPAPTPTNLFSLADVATGMTSIIGDVRDFEALKQVFTNHLPEIVIHMAAQPLVRYSYTNPVETYATNVMGTVHLLEAIRQVGGVKAVVNVTTDKCYENKEWYWAYRENEPMGGYDPYSSSKGCAELVTSAYRNAFFNLERIDDHGVALASARAGNVIGGGDWAQDRLVPGIMEACLQGSTLKIRHPNAIRPWQHVLEPLSGYLLLAQRLYEQPAVFADAWNFGPEDNDVKSVSWLADYIFAKWQSGANWEQDGGEQLHEATYLKLDCSKAKAKLGWYPRWNIKKTLDEVVDWYKIFHDKGNLREISLAQIQKYLAT